jgi:hypothetical protein
MAAARSGYTATLLDGRVLVTGGEASGVALSSLEVFDPATNSFSFLFGSLSSPRQSHAAVLLSGGSVLLVGRRRKSLPLAGADRSAPVRKGAKRNSGPKSRGRLPIPRPVPHRARNRPAVCSRHSA